METLGADYREIQEELGFFLGFGRDPAVWAADDLASVVAWIKSGLRRFLFAAYQAKHDNVYDWSFLKQSYKFGTQAGQTEYDLPGNFGSPDGPILWDSPQQWYAPIEWMNEALVRTKLSLTQGLSSIPRIAANFQKRTGGATEQTQALVLWPIPDASYPLRLSYNLLPGMLTEKFPWPPGGSPHARTLLYACLAESCKRGDDSDAYEAQYQIALAASINYDARQRSDNLGYAGDRSGRMERGYGWHGHDEPFTDLRVLINGTMPD